MDKLMILVSGYILGGIATKLGIKIRNIETKKRRAIHGKTII